MPDETEDRTSVTEIILGIVLLLLLAPGAIWWIGTIIGLFSETVLVGCR